MVADGFNFPRRGVAIDFTHDKVKANLDDPGVGGSFHTLDFTEGLNTAMLNALYRAPSTTVSPSTRERAPASRYRTSR